MTRLVWATNIAAPYRLPMWTALNDLVDLHVWTMADREFNREWNLSAPQSYNSRTLETWKFRRGEETHYVLRRTPADLHDCIILPSWTSPASWQLLARAKMSHVPTLAFNESTIASRKARSGPLARARRAYFRAVSGVITVSPASTESVLECGVPLDRIHETVNSIDVAAFSTAIAIDTEERTGHRFLFCGQLIDRKNCQMVIEAMSDDALNADELIIVGSGPNRTALERLVGELDIADRVTFRGYVDPSDLPSIYGSADTLVLPSSEEVHGLVAVEALAAGMHVVVSDVAGVTSAIRGMPGVLVTKPSLRSLIAAMAMSRSEWRGRIALPQVWASGPDRMARDIRSAVNAVLR